MATIKDVEGYNKLTVGENQYYFTPIKKYVYIFDYKGELLFMLPSSINEIVRAGIIGYNNGVENTKKELL